MTAWIVAAAVVSAIYLIARNEPTPRARKSDRNDGGSDVGAFDDGGTGDGGADCGGDGGGGCD